MPNPVEMLNKDLGFRYRGSIGDLCNEPLSFVATELGVNSIDFLLGRVLARKLAPVLARVHKMLK